MIKVFQIFKIITSLVKSCFIKYSNVDKNFQNDSHLDLSDFWNDLQFLFYSLQ